MLPANCTPTGNRSLSGLKLPTPFARNAARSNLTPGKVGLLDEVYRIVNSLVSRPSCVLYSCQTECMLQHSMTQAQIHLLATTRLCWSLTLRAHKGRSPMLNKRWVNVSPFNTNRLPSCINSSHRAQNKRLTISNLLLVQSRWQ